MRQKQTEHPQSECQQRGTCTHRLASTDDAKPRLSLSAAEGGGSSHHHPFSVGIRGSGPLPVQAELARLRRAFCEVFDPRTVLLALAVLLSGCSLEVRSRPAEPEPPKPPVVHLDGWASVEQVEFPDAGVTCWVFSSTEKGGISCLPTGGAR